MTLRVEPTRDREYLRRWMLRPSVLRGVLRGLPPMAPAAIERDFDAVVRSPARFFAVHVDGEEKGCILFKQREDATWELHICLATWHSTTRLAVKIAIGRMGPTTIHGDFCASNRAVMRLLDDLGFSAPEIFQPAWSTEPWCRRTLRLQNPCKGT